MQGRRERSYPEDTGATEDVAARRPARSSATRVHFGRGSDKASREERGFPTGEGSFAPLSPGDSATSRLWRPFRSRSFGFAPEQRSGIAKKRRPVDECRHIAGREVTFLGDEGPDVLRRREVALGRLGGRYFRRR